MLLLTLSIHIIGFEFSQAAYVEIAGILHQFISQILFGVIVGSWVAVPESSSEIREAR